MKPAATPIENTIDSKFSTCQYCNERYSVGPVTIIGPPGNELLYLPEAEKYYWQHCLTDRHQRVMKAQATDQKTMLDHIQKNWPAIKADNKLYQSEDYQRWLKVLR